MVHKIIIYLYCVSPCREGILAQVLDICVTFIVIWVYPTLQRVTFECQFSTRVFYMTVLLQHCVRLCVCTICRDRTAPSLLVPCVHSSRRSVLSSSSLLRSPLTSSLSGIGCRAHSPPGHTYRVEIKTSSKNVQINVCANMLLQQDKQTHICEIQHNMHYLECREKKERRVCWVKWKQKQSVLENKLMIPGYQSEKYTRYNINISHWTSARVSIYLFVKKRMW